MQTDQADPINSCRDITESDWQRWTHEMLDLFYDPSSGPGWVWLFDDGKSESDQCLLLSPGDDVMSTTQGPEYQLALAGLHLQQKNWIRIREHGPPPRINFVLFVVKNSN